MKSRTEMWIAAVCLFATLATTIQLSAQDNSQPKVKHHKYKVVDIGTFGGPTSFFNVTQVNGSLGLNKGGIAVGTSATSIPTDKYSNGWVCGGTTGLIPFVFHAFEWKNNVVTDLGGLAGDKRCNNPLSLNARGDIVGASEINRFDHSLKTREVRAVLWKNGKIKNLGTFGGAHSSAASINDRGQIVGVALNKIPDTSRVPPAVPMLNDRFFGGCRRFCSPCLPPLSVRTLGSRVGLPKGIVIRTLLICFNRR